MKQQKPARVHSKRKSDPPKKDNIEQKRGKALSLKHIKQNYSTIPSNELVLHHSKSGIINKFSQQFLNKFKMDYAANEAISSFDQKKLRRLSAIEAQISKINQQNSERIDELTKMENNFIKRIQQQIKKDQQKQQKLKKQYEKLLKQEEKIVLTRGVRIIKEKEDWVAIQKQQRKMELMVKVLEKRHLIMGRDISHDFKKYQKKEKEDVNKSVGNDKSNKKQRKKKTADELKEMGRQFLEHAKKFQADNLKASTKLLDVYKKNIDYLPQMKVMLKSNAVDLSKPIQDAQQIVKTRRKKGVLSRNTK